MKKKIYNIIIGTLLLLTGGVSAKVTAQEYRQPIFERSAAFTGPEQLHYTVYFRWGIIKGKAGNAIFRMQKITNGNQWFQQLRFKTTGIFESVFPMRDTLEVLYDHAHLPKRWEKRVDEGGYYLADEITYTYGDKKVQLRVKRRNATSLRIDTMVTVTHSKPIADMLSAFTLVRGIDRSKVKLNYREPFVVPIGRDMVSCEVVYAGREVMTLPGGQDKEVIKLFLNVADEAFSKKAQSAEIWVTDDEYVIPVKVRAKLKVGYAECVLSSVTRQ